MPIKRRSDDRGNCKRRYVIGLHWSWSLIRLMHRSRPKLHSYRMFPISYVQCSWPACFLYVLPPQVVRDTIYKHILEVDLIARLFKLIDRVSWKTFSVTSGSFPTHSLWEPSHRLGGFFCCSLDKTTHRCVGVGESRNKQSSTRTKLMLQSLIMNQSPLWTCRSCRLLI